MTRSCGDCTMCCKLMIVPELNKPQDKWCAKCKVGAGCGIYDQRPKSCVDFNCLWLQGYGTEDMRPDKSKVVMGMTTDGKTLVLYVDKARPDAWRETMFKAFIDKLVAAGKRAYIVIGQRRIKVEKAQIGF